MPKTDSLGDRMKFYESFGGDSLLMPRIPTLARLDGKAFHTFCKGLERPYDARLGGLMQSVTAFLIKETNPVIGYTQSDEITLIWLNEERDSMIFFDGRIHKMVSVLAALATAQFNKLLPNAIPEKADKLPVFDCRVWNVPNKGEAVNNLVWREQDATRNSISMAAQANYSHQELQGKKTNEMHDMLHAKGINWNNYSDAQKRGVYMRRETYEKSPGVMRTRVATLEMPPLVKIVNRVEFIFDNEEPQTYQEE
jgi:tRNA(His) 5'-end guanylyltransferase|tara:strand:+ start:1088 stop:1846 length:759 start_codon:yes stop_codon:yes gene_type:complete